MGFAAPLLPPGCRGLLERFLIDALRAGDRAAEGHRVVAGHGWRRLPLVRCPVLLVDAVDDPDASPFVERLHTELPTSTVTRIPGGGVVPLPDQLPKEFVRAIVASSSAAEAGGSVPRGRRSASEHSADARDRLTRDRAAGLHVRPKRVTRRRQVAAS